EALPPPAPPRAGTSAGAARVPATPRANSPALGEAEAADGRVRVPKAPPAPIVERPSRDRPDPRAQWIPGYWEWDPSRDDFVWVGGPWQIPPAGMIWVAGRWIQDAGGWFWVPGSWGPRNRPAVTTNRPAWRTTGPPAVQPDDAP